MEKRSRIRSEKIEFLLALVIAALLIISLLSQKFLDLPAEVTTLLIIAFILIKVYNISRLGGTIFEDYVALIIILIFFFLNTILKISLNPTIIVSFTLIILYSVGVIPWVKTLIKSRNIMSFIFNYIVFVLVIIFLFSGMYLENNTEFITSSGNPIELSFEETIYFSTMTFTTVGYGDLAPMGTNRLVSSIEAIIGITLNIAFIGYLLASRRTIEEPHKQIAK